MDQLREMYQPKKTRYAEFEISLPPDIQPETARAAAWLDPIRNVDALLHVVRDFQAEHVFHVAGSVDPGRDLDLVQTELLLADLDLVEKRLDRLAHETAKREADLRRREQLVLERCRDWLEDERPIRTMELAQDEAEALHSLQFLTRKPMVLVLNVDEDRAGETYLPEAIAQAVATQGISGLSLSAAIEAELIELSEEERRDFMTELEVDEPAAHRLSRAAFEALGLISFFTVGPDEVRAWPVIRGATAPTAAGRIHSDLERGFIRAETIYFEDLINAGTEKAAHEANAYRLNGKDYIVRDGDILNIRFSV